MTLARGQQGGRSWKPWIELPPRWVYVLAGWCVVAGLALPWLARWQGVLRVESEAPARARARALRPALIELPGGTFVMGSPASEPGRGGWEGPQHQVTVSGFEICQTEVTQGQWEAVMGSNPSVCRDGCGEALAVQNVSWYEAIEYLNALTERENRARGENEKLAKCYQVEGERVEWKEGCTGYRLPTEAEWEYAARAGRRTAYSFGADEGKLGEYAWYEENADGKVHEVGKKKPNRWGLYDVHGNVWEWVWDRYGAYGREVVTDPRGPGEEDAAKFDDGPARMVRGGAFVVGSVLLRSANRSWLGPRNRGGIFGLRCARSVSPAWPSDD